MATLNTALHFPILAGSGIIQPSETWKHIAVGPKTLQAVSLLWPSFLQNARYVPNPRTNASPKTTKQAIRTYQDLS